MGFEAWGDASNAIARRRDLDAEYESGVGMSASGWRMEIEAMSDRAGEVGDEMGRRKIK
jgi:hypothetical protein